MDRLKTENKVVGLKQSVKKVKLKAADTVYIASDANSALTEPLVRLCAENDVTVVTVKSMKELAKACGIDVPAACAAVLKTVHGQ